MTPAEYDAWYDTPRGRWIATALPLGGLLVFAGDRKRIGRV